MSHLEIHLNTGACITVDCTGYSVRKDPASQRITKLEWETPTRRVRKLIEVDLDAIVALVEVSK